MKDRPGHDRRYAIDSSKAQAKLGWAPRHALRGGARRDGALVRREPRLVGADHLRRVPRVLRAAVRGRGTGEGRGHRRERAARRRGGGAARPAATRCWRSGRGRAGCPPGPYTWAAADLGDGAAVAAALLEFRAEAVLHAGAVTDVDGCEREPDARLARQRRRHRRRWPAPAGRSGRGWWPSPPTTSSTATPARTARTTSPTRAASTPAPSSAARGRRCSIAPDVAVARVAVVYSGRTPARVHLRHAGGREALPRRAGEGLPRPAHLDHARLERRGLLPGAAPRDRPTAGVLHVSDATVLDRVEFARRVAAPVRPRGRDRPGRDRRREAPRPAAAPGRAQGRPGRGAAPRTARSTIDEALDRFHAEWVARRR